MQKRDYWLNEDQQELMTPYMHLLLSNFIDVLEEFQKGANSDPELWVASVEMLSKNLSSDDGSE